MDDLEIRVALVSFFILVFEMSLFKVLNPMRFKYSPFLENLLHFGCEVEKIMTLHNLLKPRDGSAFRTSIFRWRTNRLDGGNLWICVRDLNHFAEVLDV